jgi:hypothetical protein
MGSVGVCIPGPAALIGSWLTVPVVVFFVLLAVCLEMWRRAELVFLENLGYSFGRIAALITAQCVVFEAVAAASHISTWRLDPRLRRGCPIALLLLLLRR